MSSLSAAKVEFKAKSIVFFAAVSGVIGRIIYFLYALFSGGFSPFLVEITYQLLYVFPFIIFLFYVTKLFEGGTGRDIFSVVFVTIAAGELEFALNFIINMIKYKDALNVSSLIEIVASLISVLLLYHISRGVSNGEIKKVSVFIVFGYQIFYWGKVLFNYLPHFFQSTSLQSLVILVYYYASLVGYVAILVFCLANKLPEKK